MADDELADEVLLARWQGGDKHAGAALLERHHGAVARFFAHKVGPDSEDLVHDTFMALIERIDHFRREAGFRAYLFGIARRKLYRHIRDLCRDRRRFDAAETSLAAIDPSPTARMAAREEDRLLLAALRTLPLDTQVMLELHYWERMKIREIAEVLEMDAGTIRVRMSRGRKKLEQAMESLAESSAQLETSISNLSGWAARLQADLGDAKLARPPENAS